jgi:hypothetical protein
LRAAVNYIEPIKDLAALLWAIKYEHLKKNVLARAFFGGQ